MTLEALHSPPEEYGHLAEVIDGIDRCFLTGFSRLEERHRESLETLGRAMGGTPIENALTDAVKGIRQGIYSPQRLAAIAVARETLHGVAYDLLARQAATACGRERGEEPSSPALMAPPEALAPRLDGARQWLVEVALDGFQQRNQEVLSSFSQALEGLRSTPELVRLATLLTGFSSELAGAVTREAADVPLRRWCDLWCRAMLGTLKLPAPPTMERYSGPLELLGVDVLQSPWMAQLTGYGMLSDQRIARFGISSWKVDVIVEASLFLLFEPEHKALLTAGRAMKSLKLADMELTPLGDMAWTGKATLGGKVDCRQRWEQVSQAASVPEPAAHDRHPVHVAEPIFLDGIKVSEEKGHLVVETGEGKLPVAMHRFCRDSMLTPEALHSAECAFGLLRFDSGHWQFQPLGIDGPGKKKREIITNLTPLPAKKGKKPSGETVEILRERAGKLLRKKY